MTDKQRKARLHREVEKRYRDGLHSEFRRLEKILLSRHGGNLDRCDVPKDTQNGANRPKRLAVLKQASDDLLNLQAEVHVLRRQFETLKRVCFL